MQNIRRAVHEINQVFSGVPDISLCYMIMHWIDDLECQAARVKELLTEFQGCSQFVTTLHRDSVALATTEREKGTVLMALRRNQSDSRQVAQVILTGEVQTPAGTVSQRLFGSLSEGQRIISSATTERFG
jgi:hypothetical protein